ncbi:MAG TPA: hypothetical protein VJ809_10265, partial [Pirellulales bacterium]|nr:hypothetical protein [Pirellulales bacterium]
MIELDLRRELEAVAERYRRRRLWGSLAICWLAFALVGAAFVAWAREGGTPATGVAPILGVLALVVAGAIVLLAWRRARDSAWLAHRIEGRFPELDARLLTAVGETDAARGQLGFLQQTVVRETLAHARRNPWESIVSDRSLRAVKLAQTAALCGFVVVLGNLFIGNRPDGDAAAGLVSSSPLNAVQPLEITVEPEDTSIERGTSLLVLARFEKRLPGDVRLIYRKPGAEQGSLAMSKSLDDPVFAGRILSVNEDLTYSVQYDDQQTRWYKVQVFDYPELVRADARLKFPEYTGMAETVVEDTRSVTAVEGTKLTLIMRLNKPVTEARLDPSAAAPKPAAATQSATTTNAPSKDSLTLAADPVDPNTYTTSLDLTQSRRYRLQLVDAEGRKNKLPPEIVINVTPNRPPDVKLEAPARDVQVSPLEELALKARVYDDF